MRKLTGTWNIEGDSILISVMEDEEQVNIIVPDNVEKIPTDYIKSKWQDGDSVEVIYIRQKSGVRKAKKVRKT